MEKPQFVTEDILLVAKFIAVAALIGLGIFGVVALMDDALSMLAR